MRPLAGPPFSVRGAGPAAAQTVGVPTLPMLFPLVGVPGRGAPNVPPVEPAGSAGGFSGGWVCAESKTTPEAHKISAHNEAPHNDFFMKLYSSEETALPPVRRRNSLNRYISLPGFPTFRLFFKQSAYRAPQLIYPLLLSLLDREQQILKPLQFNESRNTGRQFIGGAVF